VRSVRVVVIAVSAAALVALTLPYNAARAATVTVSVPAAQPWTDTGVDVAAGSTVSISASGVIKIAGSDPGKTPNGTPGCVATPAYVAPNLTCYILLARIGSGAPRQVGSSDSFLVPTAGRLFLGVNDEVFADNSGAWTVNVTTDTTPPTPPTGPVCASRLAVSPQSGTPATSVTVTGCGWNAGEGVALSWDFAYATKVAHVTAGSDGSFTATIQVPGSAPARSTYVDAISDTGRSAQAPFTVTPVGTSPVVAATPCRAHFLGLHGLGEDQTSKTITTTLDAVRSWAADHHHPGEVDGESLRTPTHTVLDLANPANLVTVVHGQISESLTVLDLKIEELKATDTASHCTGGSRFVLAGYSEGAWIVDQYLAQYGEYLAQHPGASEWVRGVALYGDPQWRHGYGTLWPFSAVYGQGMTRWVLGGRYQIPGAYPALNSVQSICINQDPVCGEGYSALLAQNGQDAAAAACTVVTCPHYGYTDAPARTGGSFLGWMLFPEGAIPSSAGLVPWPTAQAAQGTVVRSVTTLDANAAAKTLSKVRMGALARTGGFTATANATVAGNWELGLYVLARNGRSAEYGARSAKQRAVARAAYMRAVFSQPGSRRLTVRLTNDGLRVFRQAKRSQRLGIEVGFVRPNVRPNRERYIYARRIVRLKP
jgi:hypothetical protein